MSDTIEKYIIVTFSIENNSVLATAKYSMVNTVFPVRPLVEVSISCFPNTEYKKWQTKI